MRHIASHERAISTGKTPERNLMQRSGTWLRPTNGNLELPKSPGEATLLSLFLPNEPTLELRQVSNSISCLAPQDRYR